MGLACHRKSKATNFIEKENFMKIVLNTLAVLFILAGGIWFLQGINVLPGSFMTGDPQWAINGGIMIVIGGIILWWNNRGKKNA